MSDTRILIVHPDPSATALLSSMLRSMGGMIDETNSGPTAVKRLEHETVDLVIVGVNPEDPDALELLHYIRRKHGRLPVILLFSNPHPERCREAMQRGASTVLRFPVPAMQLRAAVAQALGPITSRPAPVAQAPAPQAVAASTNGWTVVRGSVPAATPRGHDERHEPAAEHDDTLVGEDQGLRHAFELAESLAPTRASILIEGEAGTGKSLLARMLHRRSPRRLGPFVEIDASAFRGAALEAELFGRKGPGGEQQGKLAQARGGTLFLDNVGALEPDLQLKLLRVVEDQEFEAVGSTQTQRCDVRFVFGTAQPLAELVEQESFRQDLYYRMSVLCLKLPPLRHRDGDIERLADHFRVLFSRAAGKEVVGFATEALDMLRSHDWPGNVRELEAAIERGVLLCQGPRILPAHLGLTTAIVHSKRFPMEHTPPAVAGRMSGKAAGLAHIKPLKEALEEPEKRIILEALEATNWNRQETARVLDINRTTLYKKMKKYGLLYDEPAWAN